MNIYDILKSEEFPVDDIIGLLTKLVVSESENHEMVMKEIYDIVAGYNSVFPETEAGDIAIPYIEYTPETHSFYGEYIVSGRSSIMQTTSQEIGNILLDNRGVEEDSEDMTYLGDLEIRVSASGSDENNPFARVIEETSGAIDLASYFDEEKGVWVYIACEIVVVSTKDDPRVQQNGHIPEESL